MARSVSEISEALASARATLLELEAELEEALRPGVWVAVVRAVAASRDDGPVAVTATVRRCKAEDVAGGRVITHEWTSGEDCPHREWLEIDGPHVDLEQGRARVYERAGIDEPALAAWASAFADGLRVGRKIE